MKPKLPKDMNETELEIWLELERKAGRNPRKLERVDSKEAFDKMLKRSVITNNKPTTKRKA